MLSLSSLATTGFGYVGTPTFFVVCFDFEILILLASISRDAQIMSLCHYTWFIWCWGLNPVPYACQTSTSHGATCPGQSLLKSKNNGIHLPSCIGLSGLPTTTRRKDKTRVLSLVCAGGRDRDSVKKEQLRKEGRHKHRIQGNG